MKLAPHVSRASTEEGAVLLDETTGDYWMLNITAAQILDLALQDVSLDRCASHIAADFETSAEQALIDAQRLMRSLLDRGLVKP